MSRLSFFRMIQRSHNRVFFLRFLQPENIYTHPWILLFEPGNIFHTHREGNVIQIDFMQEISVFANAFSIMASWM